MKVTASSQPVVLQPEILPPTARLNRSGDKTRALAGLCLACGMMLVASARGASLDPLPDLGNPGRVGGPAVEFGAIRGSVVHLDTILPRSTDEYTLTFRAGEVAWIRILGEQVTDLDLYVYDASGTLVAMDDDLSSYCIASWVPWRTGTYTVRIVNRGSSSNSYLVRTN